jgi:hypothetical protein
VPDRSLSHIQVAFCHSIEALKAARRDGLPANAEIRTSAPALLAEPGINAINIDDMTSAEELTGFLATIDYFIAQMFDAFRGDPNLSDFALVAAFHAHASHLLLLRALALEPVDMEEPRLVVDVDTNDASVNNSLRSPYANLLLPNPNLVHLVVRVPSPVAGSEIGGRRPSVMTRFRRLTANRLAYLIGREITRRLPMMLRKGTIYVRQENDLLKEVAGGYAARGWALETLERRGLTTSVAGPTAGPTTGAEGTLRSAAEEVCRAVFDRCFDGFFSAAMIHGLKSLVTETLVADVLRQAASRQAARVIFERSGGGQGKPAMVFFGAPLGGIDIGVAHAADDAGMSSIGFQHGVRREIANWPIDLDVLFENNICDLTLTYNRQGAEASRQSPFSIGEVEAIGLPKSMQTRTRVQKQADQPIIYVSTSLCRGFRQNLNSMISDEVVSRRECDLLTKVFGALPHRVLYKPYPSIRYIDEDIEKAAARRQSNIDIFTDMVDVRYFLPRHRVLVTGGATSTVAWCIISNRPLVYIEDRDRMPLSDVALALFREAFFVFDRADAEFESALKAFLSQPLDQIDAAWRARAPAIERVQKELLGWNSPPPSVAGSRVIRRSLKSGSASKAARRMGRELV